jgi:hypothetical protein
MPLDEGLAPGTLENFLFHTNTRNYNLSEETVTSDHGQIASVGLEKSSIFISHIWYSR